MSSTHPMGGYGSRIWRRYGLRRWPFSPHQQQHQRWEQAEGSTVAYDEGLRQDDVILVMHRYGFIGLSEGQGIGVCRTFTRIATRQDRSKEQRPPSGVAVFPLDSSTVYSACMHPHRIALCLSDRGSSSDSASIVGGALQRIFQPLRDEIDHHIPSCTAVVLVEAHAPNHKAAKALIHRDQVWHLVLKPGRMLAPSRLRAHRRKGADGRKFAEPSDDLHHIACLSSVRACW